MHSQRNILMTAYAKHIALANTPASNMREYANDHMAE